MTGYRFIAALLPLIVCSLTGCTIVQSTIIHGTLMQGAPLPEGFSVKNVAKADAGAPFAVDRSGGFAAISKGSLEIINPEGPGQNYPEEPAAPVSKAALEVIDPGTGLNIARGTATGLCFSPDGARLAAALPAGNMTILRLFDRKGKTLSETTIAGRVTSIAWRSEAQLLATALSIKKFTFGSELRSILYLWDGTTPPVATPLSDVTVRPALANLPEEALFQTLQLALSPYGDEIAYSSLKDPPLFTPYLRIVIRHIGSGAEREVGRTSVGSGAPLYTPDGESLLVGDAQSLTRRLSIPNGRETNAWPSPGSYPALSPSGSYVFLDGRLYKNDRTIALFPSQARVTFMPDGSRLAISSNGMLYMVSGLQDQAAASNPADLGRLLKLRRLRSLGLITEKQYKAQKGNPPAR